MSGPIRSLYLVNSVICLEIFVFVLKVVSLAQALSVSPSPPPPVVGSGLVPLVAHQTAFLEAPTPEVQDCFPSRIMPLVPTNQPHLAVSFLLNVCVDKCI